VVVLATSRPQDERQIIANPATASRTECDMRCSRCEGGRDARCERFATSSQRINAMNRSRARSVPGVRVTQIPNVLRITCALMARDANGRKGS
jgi:hypothetical protein